jgi:GTPase SAR1 family protein
VVKWDDSTEIRLQLWDIAGQVPFEIITVMNKFCRACTVCVVYTLTVKVGCVDIVRVFCVCKSV